MGDKDDKDDKAARLAAALRANLKRRKAQARGDAPHHASHESAEDQRWTKGPIE